MRIRAEDVARSIPDLASRAMAQVRDAHTAAVRDAERHLIWQVRRDAALAMLAGWVPPTPTQRWWNTHERDALAYAEVFAPD